VYSRLETPGSLVSPGPASTTSATEGSTLPEGSPVAPSNSIEADAELALELSSPSSVRRSTRLRNKPKTQGKPEISELSPTFTNISEAVDKFRLCIKPVKPVVKLQPQIQQEPTPQILTLAEPIVSPFDVAISTSYELPALHSSEWQLMYPAGGSTHPAYPWPSTDPRLVFHAHFVPLVNGLPNVVHVPELKLPLGWRHTSWSGLHPVVFDPHQQLFKLTPVGPLPLTSEELHQGGMQDYAPGGKLHPEYDLLPLMCSLGDGSDYEIFNFEGVDWRLPWALIEGMPEDRIDVAEINTVTDTEPKVEVVPVVQLSPRYVGRRDCPDDVFDLQDGWRWLTNMEENPRNTFSPTPGRKWRGTGVHLTARRTKQPIAALMATTMAEKEQDNMERYLANQNGREFCPFKSVCTPVHVNITLLQDVEFTLVELLSYFPLHYQWRNAGDRMARAGMSAKDISNFINMTRFLPGQSVCSYGSVDHHVFRKPEDETAAKNTHSTAGITSYTAEHWIYTVWEMTDYPLLALAHGLVELPTGVDAGPLTNIIKWVREKGRYQTMLSEVPILLKEANIEPLIDPGEGNDPDREVLPRHMETMKADRKRIIQEQKELAAAKEKRPKKRKLG
jgi:hypothetical protein